MLFHEWARGLWASIERIPRTDLTAHILLLTIMLNTLLFIHIFFFMDKLDRFDNSTNLCQPKILTWSYISFSPGNICRIPQINWFVPLTTEGNINKAAITRDRLSDIKIISLTHRDRYLLYWSQQCKYKRVYPICQCTATVWAASGSRGAAYKYRYRELLECYWGLNSSGEEKLFGLTQHWNLVATDVFHIVARSEGCAFSPDTVLPCYKTALYNAEQAVRRHSYGSCLPHNVITLAHSR